MSYVNRAWVWSLMQLADASILQKFAYLMMLSRVLF